MHCLSRKKGGEHQLQPPFFVFSSTKVSLVRRPRSMIGLYPSYLHFLSIQNPKSIIHQIKLEAQIPDDKVLYAECHHSHTDSYWYKTRASSSPIVLGYDP
jgi:hypothetical protein